MTDLIKLVNGKEQPLSEAEVEAFILKEEEEISKQSRLEELQPLKNFFKFRINAYEDRLGNTKEQLGLILESGDLAGPKAIYDQIRNVDYPWTDELRDLKASCTEEELKYCRGN